MQAAVAVQGKTAWHIADRVTEVAVQAAVAVNGRLIWHTVAVQAAVAFHGSMT